MVTNYSVRKWKNGKLHFFFYKLFLLCEICNWNIVTLHQFQNPVAIYHNPTNQRSTCTIEKYWQISSTYLPIFVIIISVPILWNSLHRSWFSRETLMLGSVFTWDWSPWPGPYIPPHGPYPPPRSTICMKQLTMIQGIISSRYIILCAVKTW
mgnify:CR=1 FL=1